MHIAALLIALAIAGAPEQASSYSNKPIPGKTSESGTICVLPNSEEPPARISPGGHYNPATLTISIDKQKPIYWPHKQSVKIEKLSLNDRHLVTLRSDGKRIQSFWFRFSDYKEPKLCMAFDGYQGVQFGDKHGALWCKCR